jgi:hypothetical protein
VGILGVVLVSLSLPLLMSCGGGSPGLEVLGIRDRRLRSGEAAGERNFARLMSMHFQGTPARQPWAGFWWPYTSNGIAKNISGLSPAGKYDAARGGLTAAQDWEAVNHGAGVPGVEGWWGHCNGWCVAAALFPEPRQAVRVNGVEFGVADIKALLSEAGMEASADYFGDRVDSFDRNAARKWDDPVPNQYFLVLMNYMGIHRRTVLIDRHTGPQVWNQPLAGYRFDPPKPTDYLGADPAAPNVYRIRVTSTLWWMEDNVPPGALSPVFNFQTNSMVKSRTLQMELWLDGPVEFDSSGKIIKSGDIVIARDGEFLVGGKWLGGRTNQGHPDYMWVPYSILKPDPQAEVKHANVYVDIDWIRRHILSGGVDDDSVNPAPVRTAPEASPVPLPSDDVDPGEEPSGLPTTRPTPQPTLTSRPSIPTPTSRPTPTIVPTSVPTRPAPEPTSAPRPTDPATTPSSPAPRPTSAPQPTPPTEA